MQKPKKLGLKLTATLMLIGYTVIMLLTPFACPIKSITGISCLGCGLTRAFLSAFRLDFVSAFSHHFMFWSVPLLFVCFLLDGKLFKSKKINIVFYILILAGFIINWIMHLK